MIDIGNEDYPASEAAFATPLSNDRLLSPAQVCAYLRCGISTLDRMRIRGEGPPYLKIGKRRVGYRWSSIQTWLDSRECQSTIESKAKAKSKSGPSATPGEVM